MSYYQVKKYFFIVWPFILQKPLTIAFMSLSQPGIFDCCQRSKQKLFDGFSTRAWFSKANKKGRAPRQFLGDGKGQVLHKTRFLAFLHFSHPLQFLSLFSPINGKLICLFFFAFVPFCQANKTRYYFLLHLVNYFYVIYVLTFYRLTTYMRMNTHQCIRNM